MSHLIIQRRRTQSLRTKIHSQQSRSFAPRHSIGKILNDNISKRRFTTHNSQEQSQDQQGIQTQIEQAKLLYKNKNTKSALGMFKKLHNKYPQNSEILYFMGSCLLNQGNFDASLMYFKSCLALAQVSNKNIYICMAICYKAQGKFKQSIQVLNTGCQIYPRFKDGYFYKGKLCLKLGQLQQAAASFRKCIKLQPDDDHSRFFLAECLKNMGNVDEALQKYEQLIKQNSRYLQKALIKKISILIQCKKFSEAKIQINKAINYNIQSVQLKMFQGICQYQSANYNEAATYLQLSLTSNSSEANITKCFRYLIQINIKQKDFFEAEHLISRSKFVNANKKQLALYYKLVEGVNDLIKRRLQQCQQKLNFVYTNSIKKSTDSEKFIHQNCLPYFAYCQFSLQKFQKSLQIYKQYVKSKSAQKKLQQYNCYLCQGLVLHKKKKYSQAEQKFRNAQKLMQDKVQPLFLICVNLIQEKKDCIQQQNTNKKVFQRLQKQFKTVQKSGCQNPLFLFYQSLVLLFQGRNACEIIDRAIKISEQQVSQYYFIQALSYSTNGQTLKGLQSITKAIELDHNIPQFFKQRSKYFYALQRYDEAVTDIVSILQLNQDQQARLLLTFYYYMTNQYSLSLDILKQISTQCSQDKFAQFQTALYFRLHRYEKCGVAGTLISKILKKQKIRQQILQSIKTSHIQNRQTYSQFTVCFFHLLFSCYYFYTNDYEQCLQHLFGALQQIQIQTQSQQNYSTLSQNILNQIKFNISIACLLKQLNCTNKQSINLQQTYKYLQMFIAESEGNNFIKIMGIFKQLLQLKRQRPDNNKQIIRILQLYTDVAKLSDDLPEISICIGCNITIKTKFLILYPHKIKFNIYPQFDQSFLFNFDIDKIQSKLLPPWFKLHKGHIFFTDKIRNQSVLISETQKPATPSLILAPSPLPVDIKQKLKLDDAVEKKLQKFMQANMKDKNKSNNL